MSVYFILNKHDMYAYEKMIQSFQTKTHIYFLHNDTNFIKKFKNANFAKKMQKEKKKEIKNLKKKSSKKCKFYQRITKKNMNFDKGSNKKHKSHQRIKKKRKFVKGLKKTQNFVK